MTRKERLMAIFRGETPDRPAVKLWGAMPGKELRHPAYEPVLRRALELTDLVMQCPRPADICLGKRFEALTETCDEPSGSDEWVDRVTTVRAPAGTLRSVFRKSTCKRPGYTVEHLLKEPGDIRKLLSVPYEPFDFTPNEYVKRQRELGDAGIVLFGLDHAGHALQRLIGSEDFAFWTLECKDLLREAVALFAQRLREHVTRVFDAGLRPIFGWVGPELFIPPLLSPDDFETFSFEMDKPLIDLIHERGGHAWVHCHGKMGPVLERFADMGVDVLNPIEPPPMGDMTLDEAFARVDGRMALEGNIESHDLMTAPPAVLRDKIRQGLAAATDGRRLILCPSSGFDEDAEPSQRLLDNLMLYVEEGVQMAEACARGRS